MKKILVFGSVAIDDVYQVDHIVKPGETISSRSYQTFPGGKGQNQAVACARAEAHTYFAGCIGADGLHLKELMAKSNVDTTYLKVGDVPTGRAIIQLDPTSINSIVLNDGANATVDNAMVDAVLPHFDKGDLLVMQNELHVTSYLIDQAAAMGMTVIFNVSPVNHRLQECDFSKVNYLFINETEGEALTQKTDPQDILDDLLARYPAMKIVLTLGELGSWYADATKRIHGDAVKVKAVDTTGAGDTFTGYFVSSLVKDLPIEECLSRASRASGLSVTKNGAAISIPSLQEVLSF